MMSHTLFISDLHLHPQQQHTIELFWHFLKTQAPCADTLYILGDFFDAWPGDDDDTPAYTETIQRLKTATDNGLPIHFLRGNRDFMIGKQFAKQSGCQLLNDPSIIQLYGKKVVITHGDLLCTNDKEHLRYRRIIQNPFTVTLGRYLPLRWRKKIAQKLRKNSREKFSNTQKNRYDATSVGIANMLLDLDSQIMIHGHTHQPIIEHKNWENISGERIVLGDWHDEGSVLRWNDDGSKTLERIMF